MVRFADFDRAEFKLLQRIVARAEQLADKHFVDYDRQTITMDLSAVHAHTPLRLEALAEADDADFAHDIFGIRRHLNRETGELERGFHPRLAQPAGAGAR